MIQIIILITCKCVVTSRILNRRCRVALIPSKGTLATEVNTTVMHRNRNAMKDISGGRITIEVVEVSTAALNVRISAMLTRHNKFERLSRSQTLVSGTRHVKPMRFWQISESYLPRVRVVRVALDDVSASQPFWWPA